MRALIVRDGHPVYGLALIDYSILEVGIFKFLTSNRQTERKCRLFLVRRCENIRKRKPDHFEFELFPICEPQESKFFGGLGPQDINKDCISK